MLLLLERDNLIAGATDKRIYAVSIDGIEPAPAGTTPPVLDRWLVRDLLETDGWTYEKAEGVAVVDKDLVVINDNDGVVGAPTQALIVDHLGNGDWESRFR